MSQYVPNTYIYVCRDVPRKNLVLGDSFALAPKVQGVQLVRGEGGGYFLF